MRATAVLVSLFAFAPLAAADCNLCGEGLEIANPEAQVALPGELVRSCYDLVVANQRGAIDDNSCSMLTMFTPEICCGPAEIIVASEDLADIATTLTNAGTFSLLVSALQIANLIEALSDPMAFYTVFAPSDAAFDGLEPGLVDALLIPENSDWLTEGLLYHVVPGEYSASDLENETLLSTLESSSLSVSVSNETGVMINDALVLDADIMATNGIIHEIDKVLVPPSLLEVLPDLLANLTMPEMNATDAPTLEIAMTQMRPDIPTIASVAGTFEYLLKALEVTNLTSVLAQWSLHSVCSHRCRV